MVTDESDLAVSECVLAQAVDRSGITGRVSLSDAAGESGTLELTLLSSRRLPFSLNTVEATAWLEAAGVDATADYDGDDYGRVRRRTRPHRPARKLRALGEGA